MPAVRAAGWVAFLSLLAAVTLGSLAAARARSWRQVLTGALAWVHGLIPGFVLLGMLGAHRRWARLGPAVRGAALAAALLAVFVPLFVTADAAFAEHRRTTRSPGTSIASRSASRSSSSWPGSPGRWSSSRPVRRHARPPGNASAARSG